ncbi:MAG: GNAT family N-acetyltransferase [Cyanobacteria bacterium J06639_1]
MTHAIRTLTVADEVIAWEILRYAAHEDSLAAVLEHPTVARYAKSWGRDGDLGFVAVDGDRTLGAAWVRLWPDGERGFGWVRDDIPELTIAVLPDCRGRGIGTQLLQCVLEAARSRFSAVSLSVRADNPAVRLYERLGFVQVPETDICNRVGGSSFKMVHKFSSGGMSAIAHPLKTCSDETI